MKLSTLCVGISCAAAWTCNAGLITITGDFTRPEQGPLGLGIGEQSFQGINLGAGNHYLTGSVQATNTGGTAFTLILTNFEYRSDVAGPVSTTIHIVQEFAAAFPNFTGAGSHQFSGTGTFNALGQTARIDKTATHEGVVLPPLFDIKGGVGPIFPQVLPLAAGPAGAGLGDIIAIGVYRMDVTYTFTLTGGAANGAWVQITLPSSGEDHGVIVPSPASFAMLAVGLAVGRRRRALRPHRRGINPLSGSRTPTKHGQ